MVKVKRVPDMFPPPYYELDDLYRREDESTVTSGTAQATTSGTTINFTGIPSWVKKVTVAFSGVSTSGNDNMLVQIGDSGGIEATGYTGTSTLTVGATSASTAYTTGFGIRYAASTSAVHGFVQIVLLDASTNLWAFSGALATSTSVANITSGGSKALSATLDRVRITTVNGVDTFDAGSINILYE